MPNDVRNFVLDKGFDVSAQVTKYRMVKMATTPAETVSPVAAVGDTPIGIAQETVLTAEIAKGKGCPVAVIGLSAFEADTACNPGQQLVLGASANGTLAPVGTSSAGTLVVGVCVHGASAQGARGSVRLML